MIDLHMHSTYSDGREHPAVLVEKCGKLGLDLCSVTDHDAVGGQQEALEAAREHGVPYLTGIEISTDYRGGPELHILGYGFRPDDEDFLLLMRRLEANKSERVLNILSAMSMDGLRGVDEEANRLREDKPMGRPHIAQALVSLGYARDYQSAYSEYLNEGGRFYVERSNADPRAAIAGIRNAGGTPVLAHPGLIETDDLAPILRHLLDDGLQGIEAFYPAHDDGQISEYVQFAEENNLLVTCGSDYHGLGQRTVLACEKRESPLLARSAEKLRSKYLARGFAPPASR